MTNDFSLLESRWLGELADTTLLGIFLGVYHVSIVDDCLLVEGLQDLFDAGALSDANQILVQVLKDKLMGLSNEEILLLLDEKKGQNRIKYREQNEGEN